MVQIEWSLFRIQHTNTTSKTHVDVPLIVSDVLLTPHK